MKIKMLEKICCSCAGFPMTGDGRTYLALAVFATAAFVVVLMLLLGRKNNKK
ncbi:MAG: hypothetical protein IIZ59_02765 [Clostridia bacterium]|nr:hypothetical protein [Clostridia bacterium]